MNSISQWTTTENGIIPLAAKRNRFYNNTVPLVYCTPIAIALDAETEASTIDPRSIEQCLAGQAPLLTCI